MAGCALTVRLQWEAGEDSDVDMSEWRLWERWQLGDMCRACCVGRRREDLLSSRSGDLTSILMQLREDGCHVT